ncbi:MAG: phosphoribosylanthranilate isomerase [SAR86 cluster bacterium]|uniref:N-(5'-phosphoribosyl)anthranilate isomerase n=1 Tax=SAR86 cluster bacterium TaxID=2030880 RepID=A0A973A8J6_9GAMM|nr:phosphoribosylanthranilate isomerase [SAR86 cluster bacterium]
MVTRVKICGITHPDDALMAVRAGADALGFVMYEPSPRFVDAPSAQKICAQVPVFVTRVGLFVNHSREQVGAILRQVPFDLLQFHGDESNEFCASFDRPFIKAIRIAPGDDVAQLVAQYPDSRGVLLDAFVDGLYGGTGRTIDWHQLPGLNTAVVLAGGLDPNNVGLAIANAAPYGVDVSGGVERSKGRKDADKIIGFMRAVRAADDI